MQLPYTSANLMFWFDPREKFIIRDENQLVSSAYNRIDGTVIVQPNSLLKPQWSSQAINGTPGLVMTGSQYMTYHSLAFRPFLNGIVKSFAITFVMQMTGPQTGGGAAGSPLTIKNNNSGANGSIINIVIDATGSLGIRGVFQSSTGATSVLIKDTSQTDFKAKVVTFYFDGTSTFLRVNGIQVAASSSSINNIEPLICSSFVIGGYEGSPGNIFNRLTGNIGHIVIYDAPASIVDVENVLRGWSNI